MALIDAVANSIGIPLWRLFGGFSNTITTDITVRYFSAHHLLIVSFLDISLLNRPSQF